VLRFLFPSDPSCSPIVGSAGLYFTPLPYECETSFVFKNEIHIVHTLEPTVRVCVCMWCVYVVRMYRELEAMTGQWFYVISAKNKRDRQSNEVACGSDIVRASLRTAKQPTSPTAANGKQRPDDCCALCTRLPTVANAALRMVTH